MRYAIKNVVTGKLVKDFVTGKVDLLPSLAKAEKLAAEFNQTCTARGYGHHYEVLPANVAPGCTASSNRCCG